MPIRIKINNESHTVEAEPDTPLLWVIRDTIGLKGTKYGCGMAQCGACTVHLNGNAVRSCSLPLSAVKEEQEITTIEFAVLEEPGKTLQSAWIEEQVPQCGYCQSGQIMSAISLLRKNPQVTSQQIDAGMRGNLCRCGTYDRIRKAIASASDKLSAGK